MQPLQIGQVAQKPVQRIPVTISSTLSWSYLLVAELFRLQEGKLLLVSEEKLGRLHELHDQIEILRGATLNGAILFTLSWFGLCALYRAGLNNAKGDNKISAGKMRFRAKVRVVHACSGFPAPWRLGNAPALHALARALPDC